MKEYLSHRFSTDDFDFVSIVDELPLWSAPFGLELLDAVELKPQAKVLDIGCGLGFPMLELAFRLGSSGMVYGLDPWTRAVERIRLKIKVLNVRNAEIIEGVAEKMPFADKFFDLLVSNNGMNNVADWTLSLSECARVSKAGAQFVMTFNLEGTMREFYDVFEQCLRRNGLRDEINGMKAHIYAKRKPLGEVEALLRESGFHVKHANAKSFKMDFLDGTAMLNHYLVKYWFLDGWKKVLKEEDRESVFDQLEMVLNERAAQRGHFSLTIPYVTVDCRRS